ncbi:MAG: hypothetical protein KTV77_02240 [Wolbachia endosymbiont of Fragariocoptes setiger]|nr:hypothetical protein [Wolbachia endosymbiont of Fragariocoptes setiger]
MRDHLTNNSSITDKVLRNWVRDNPDVDLKAWLSDSANKGYTREEYNALYEKISEELVHTSMSINTIKNIYKKYNITPPTDEEFDMLKDKQSETRSFDYWENKTGLPFQGRINLKVTDKDNIDLFQDKNLKSNFDKNVSINNIQFLSSLEKTVQTFYDFFGIKKDNNPLLVDGNLANFRLFLFDNHESYTKHLGTQYSGQIPGGGGLAESSDNNYISNLYSHADNAHSDFNHDQKSDYQDYHYVIKHELVHGLTFYLTSKLDLGKVLMEGLAEYVTLLTEGKKASDFANLVDDKFRNMSLKEIIRGEVYPYKTGATVIAYLEETYPNFIDNLLYAATQDRKTLNGRFYFKEMMKKIYESEEKMGFSN